MGKINIPFAQLDFDSADLLATLGDETGTGLVVFNTSPTLVTPLLGTPTSGVLTNCTGLPTAGLVDGAVTKAKLAATLVDAYRVVAAGYVALPNAAATSDVATSGLVSDDIVIISPSLMATKGTVLQGLYKSATAITITSSANTATGDYAFWVVLRATT